MTLEELVRERAREAGLQRYARGERLDLRVVWDRLYEMVAEGCREARDTGFRDDPEGMPSEEEKRVVSRAAHLYYLSKYGHPYIEDEALARHCWHQTH